MGRIALGLVVVALALNVAAALLGSWGAPDAMLTLAFALAIWLSFWIVRFFVELVRAARSDQTTRQADS